MTTQILLLAVSFWLNVRNISHICCRVFCKKAISTFSSSLCEFGPKMRIHEWTADVLVNPLRHFSPLPWNRAKQNIRGFSVSVYSKRFQKIKQSVHIPFRKTSSISSHGRLSNWNDASDDKSICVGDGHRFPNVLPNAQYEQSSCVRLCEIGVSSKILSYMNVFYLHVQYIYI